MNQNMFGRPPRLHISKSFHKTMFTWVFNDVQWKAAGRERKKEDLRKKKKRAQYIVKNETVDINYNVKR